MPVVKCEECISGLVRLTEIPHMLYRNYDKALAGWYLRCLKEDSKVLLDKGCIKLRTYEGFLEPFDRTEKAVKEKDREGVYQTTEAILSVLKGWAPSDVADRCVKEKSSFGDPVIRFLTSRG